MKITWFGRPITKKNSQRLIKTGKRVIPIPSEQYKDYERDCLKQTLRRSEPITIAVNVCCIYYMPTLGRVDLANLLEATTDILTVAGVITDDNSRIVAGHDGSRVRYDKQNPRVEITITKMED